MVMPFFGYWRGMVHFFMKDLRGCWWCHRLVHFRFRPRQHFLLVFLLAEGRAFNFSGWGDFHLLIDLWVFQFPVFFRQFFFSVFSSVFSLPMTCKFSQWRFSALSYYFGPPLCRLWGVFWGCQLFWCFITVCLTRTILGQISLLILNRCQLYYIIKLTEMIFSIKVLK